MNLDVGVNLSVVDLNLLPVVERPDERSQFFALYPAAAVRIQLLEPFLHLLLSRFRHLSPCCRTRMRYSQKSTELQTTSADSARREDSLTQTYTNDAVR